MLFQTQTLDSDSENLNEDEESNVLEDINKDIQKVIKLSRAAKNFASFISTEITNFCFSESEKCFVLFGGRADFGLSAYGLAILLKFNCGTESFHSRVVDATTSSPGVQILGRLREK